MKKIIKIFLSLTALLTVAAMGIIIYYNLTLPDSFYVTSGNDLYVSSGIETVAEDSFKSSRALTAMSATGGITKKAGLKLWGIIPIKSVIIQEVKAPLLIPCGEPFGIKILTEGLLVINVGGFETSGGYVSPASDCGIKTGDIIKSVAGQKVYSNKEIEKVISKSEGNPVAVTLVREERELTVTMTPRQCSSDGCYRAGLWVRDSSAGIGTLTFYDPESKAFGGLGHPVCDVDTGKILPVNRGEVAEVSINAVRRGRSGSPGELMGSFSPGMPIGSLRINSRYGVYGEMTGFSTSKRAIPLGMRQEIKTGEAFIYSTIKGKSPEMYGIIIEKIDLMDSESGKNMIIRINDDRLIEATGGIVQGMSGSPIIQNGKLIGAVTHVFVNNPSKGYAIFAETMYDQSQRLSAGKIKDAA